MSPQADGVAQKVGMLVDIGTPLRELSAVPGLPIPTHT